MAATHAQPAKRLNSGVDADSLDKRAKEQSSEGFSISTWEGGNRNFTWGCGATQGRRQNMEDAHAVDLNIDGRTNTALFGVFDGHAGSEVSAFCARRMAPMVARNRAYQQGNIEAALQQTFLELDEVMKDQKHQLELYNLRQGIRPLDKVSEGSPHLNYGTFDDQKKYLGPYGGCTATVAVISGDDCYVASVGDSRAILSDGGKAIGLTRDHKPNDPGEFQRVKEAGLEVMNNRVATSRSSLAMSRALGDTKYKAQPGMAPLEQAVIPLPDTATAELVGTDPRGQPNFLLICCDGVFESMDNQKAITFLWRSFNKGASPAQAATALIDECTAANSLTPASRDNVTALVVRFCGKDNAPAGSS